MGKIYDKCVRFFISLQREQWLGEILWLNELLVKMMDERVELSQCISKHSTDQAA